MKQTENDSATLTALENIIWAELLYKINVAAGQSSSLIAVYSTTGRYATLTLHVGYAVNQGGERSLVAVWFSLFTS